MKKTGQLLKEKRESASLSISEVALATKINPKILTAIELGEEKNLPAKTFLKGFLRSYALFLKMDAEEVLRLYMEETGAPPPEQKPVEPAKPAAPASGGGRRKLNEENSSGLRTAAVVVIVMLIGVIIGVRELIEKYQREKVLESAEIKVSPLEQPPAEKAVETPATPVVATPPAADAVQTPPADAQAKVETSPPAATPSPAITVAVPEPTLPPAVAPVPPSPSPASVAPATPVPSPVVMVAPPAPVPAPAVVPPAPIAKKDEERKPEEVKKPEEAKKQESTAPDSAVKNVKSEIILEALDKVDVKIQIKGETKKLSLAPTQVHTIRAEQPVVFDFSDGGAVNIILNGRERGPAGELGKPKQLKLP